VNDWARLRDPGHCTPAVRLAVLGATPLFTTLTPAGLAGVNARCRAVAVDEGETIHRTGEPAQRLYVVATGLVKLLRHAADGRTVMHDLVAPGESFGALQALGDPAYGHDAVVIRGGCLLTLAAADFDALLTEVPGVATAALSITARRLREAQGAVDALSTLPVEGRLAAGLLRLARKVGRATEAGTQLTERVSQVDLAALTGTTPESVSRTFARWRRLGLLLDGATGWCLPDVGRLERLTVGAETGR
jgi:CRP/FNR family transcriptional regulator, nitrogen oxide reductase regulator